MVAGVETSGGEIPLTHGKGACVGGLTYGVMVLLSMTTQPVGWMVLGLVAAGAVIGACLALVMVDNENLSQISCFRP